MYEIVSPWVEFPFQYSNQALMLGIESHYMRYAVLVEFGTLENIGVL